MAYLKGQNLRLIVGGRCVAASTSCAVHVSAQVEDASTKDDTGDWAKNEVTGLSWDGSVDALVPEQEVVRGLVECNRAMDLEGVSAYDGGPLPAQDAGDVVVLAAAGKTVYLYNPEGNVRLAEGVDRLEFTSDGETEYCVALDEAGEVSYGIYEDKLLLAVLEDRKAVDVRLSVTGGEQNREEDVLLLRGKAYVTDFSLNAGNRQNASYTAQLTGVGELVKE